jgi:hypothetical protein
MFFRPSGAQFLANLNSRLCAISWRQLVVICHLSLVTLLAVPCCAQNAIGVLEGGPVELHGALSVVGGKPQIFSGSVIELRSGEARLLLTRGGYIRLCGPLRATFLSGGGDALLISLEHGAVELRYAARPADSLQTPDFDLTLVVEAGEIGIASASVAVDLRGQMCVSNRASLIHVIDRWAGHAYDVHDAERLLLVPEKVPIPSDQECGCAPSAPPPVVAPSPAAPRAASRPQTAATLSYPERAPEPPRASAPAASAPPASVPPASAPPPAKRKPAGKKGHNVISRLFHKIFG